MVNKKIKNIVHKAANKIGRALEDKKDPFNSSVATMSILDRSTIDSLATNNATLAILNKKLNEYGKIKYRTKAENYEMRRILLQQLELAKGDPMALGGVYKNISIYFDKINQSHPTLHKFSQKASEIIPGFPTINVGSTYKENKGIFIKTLEARSVVVPLAAMVADLKSGSLIEADHKSTLTKAKKLKEVYGNTPMNNKKSFKDEADKYIPAGKISAVMEALNDYEERGIVKYNSNSLIKDKSNLRQKAKSIIVKKIEAQLRKIRKNNALKKDPSQRSEMRNLLLDRIIVAKDAYQEATKIENENEKKTAIESAQKLLQRAHKGAQHYFRAGGLNDRDADLAPQFKDTFNRRAAEILEKDGWPEIYPYQEVNNNHTNGNGGISVSANQMYDVVQKEFDPKEVDQNKSGALKNYIFFKPKSKLNKDGLVEGMLGGAPGVFAIDKRNFSGQVVVIKSEQTPDNWQSHIPIADKITSDIMRNFLLGKNNAPKTELIYHKHKEGSYLCIVSEFIENSKDINEVKATTKADNETKQQETERNTEDKNNKVAQIKGLYAEIPYFFECAAASVILSNDDFNVGNLLRQGKTSGAIIDLEKGLSFTETLNKKISPLTVIKQSCKAANYDSSVFVDKKFIDALDRQIHKIENGQKSLHSVLKRSEMQINPQLGQLPEKKQQVVLDNLYKQLGCAIKKKESIADEVLGQINARIPALKELSTTIKIINAIENDKPADLKKILKSAEGQKIIKDGGELNWLGPNSFGNLTEEKTSVKALIEARLSKEDGSNNKVCKCQKQFKEICKKLPKEKQTEIQKQS